MPIEHCDSELLERLIRAVFDANIYVAAYLSKNPRSPNKELFRRWRAREFTLLVSQAILEEVIEKFDQRGIDQALTLELVSFILADAEFVVTSDEELPALIVDDPDDDCFWSNDVWGAQSAELDPMSGTQMNAGGVRRSEIRRDQRSSRAGA